MWKNWPLGYRYAPPLQVIGSFRSPSVDERSGGPNFLGTNLDWFEANLKLSTNKIAWIHLVAGPWTLV
jgi:hypothetical protein